MFFFQAEDGIRALVRSRGLGDVYKRQGADGAEARRVARPAGRQAGHRRHPGTGFDDHPAPVSYTHLTLPTSDLV